MIDWGNEPETLRHLFKRQAAACHEFFVRLENFNRTRNWGMSTKDVQSFASLHCVNLKNTRHHINVHNAGSMFIAIDNFETYNKLCGNVFSLKKRYEDAGGKYENF